jgi:hypothetical protein
MANFEDGDPLGRQEMADLTSRTRFAVAKWIEREGLPPADGPYVHGLPTWRRATFLAWAFDQDYLVSMEDGGKLPTWQEGERAYKRLKGEGRLPMPVRDLRRQGKLAAWQLERKPSPKAES